MTYYAPDLNVMLIGTISDGYDVTPGGQGVTEIKSTANLSNSDQLTAQINLATDRGLAYNLIVGRNTVVSGPLEFIIGNLRYGCLIPLPANLLLTRVDKHENRTETPIRDA